MKEAYSLDRKEHLIFSRSFFPLQLGNKWIFQRQEVSPYNTYFTLSIIDTAQYDNELYWKFSPFLFCGDPHYRIDSMENFVQLNNEKPILNFNMQAGDSIQIGYYPEYSDSGYTYCVKRESVITFIGSPGEQLDYFIDWYKTVIDETDVIILQEAVGPVGLSFTEHDSPMILRGAIIDGVIYGDTTTTFVKDGKQKSLNAYYLFQNYPNPFNSSTAIRYSLPQGKSSYQVSLKIYDIKGRLVNTLVDQNQAGGMYSVQWDGRDQNGIVAASGVYFCISQAGNLKSTKKMLLIH